MKWISCQNCPLVFTEWTMYIQWKLKDSFDKKHYVQITCIYETKHDIKVDNIMALCMVYNDPARHAGSYNHKHSTVIDFLGRLCAVNIWYHPAIWLPSAPNRHSVAHPRGSLYMSSYYDVSCHDAVYIEIWITEINRTLHKSQKWQMQDF